MSRCIIITIIIITPRAPCRRIASAPPRHTRSRSHMRRLFSRVGTASRGFVRPPLLSPVAGASPTMALYRLSPVVTGAAAEDERRGGGLTVLARWAASSTEDQGGLCDPGGGIPSAACLDAKSPLARRLRRRPWRGPSRVIQPRKLSFLRVPCALR